MSNIKVLHENYADSDLLNAFTYSSQIAAAPATNVLNKVRRSKVWRSAGYWDVTASNNVIKFKETTGGATLTATITADEYLTDSDFLTAVKTALEAAGDSVYTVQRDGTSNKIVITSDGSGGGNDFELLWTNVGSTAAEILGFSTAADDTGGLTYTADTLRIHTSEWLKFDLGTSSLVQAFVLIGKRNEGVQLSSTATVTLQGNTTDSWASPQYEQELTWHEDAISVFNADGLHPTGLRYWRLVIEDFDNADGYVEVSNIYLGESYSPTQGAVQFPLDFEFIDYSDSAYTPNGNSFSNIKQQTMRLFAKWFGLTKTENEALEDFIKTYGTHYPFFISLDPSAVYSSSVNKWVKFCKFEDNPKGQLEAPNVFSQDWRLREEV